MKTIKILLTVFALFYSFVFFEFYKFKKRKPVLSTPTTTSNAATGVYLSFVNGIELSGNVFSNYNKSIELHYSNVDIIDNSITTVSGNNGAKGIDARDYSTVNLTSNGTLRTGGLNIFDNAGVNVNNIYVNNSNFYLNGGRNIFGITS